jgi:hypothetical protein
VPSRFSHARRAWLVVLVVLVAGGGAYGVVRLRGPEVPVARVTRHDLEQHLVASGRVMAPARVEMAALSTGLVVAVNVREGDHVKPGDVLVQLDDAEAKAAVAQAEAAVAQARARADQIRSVASVVAGPRGDPRSPHRGALRARGRDRRRPHREGRRARVGHGPRGPFRVAVSRHGAFGTKLIARSAKAVIVSDGFTPGFADTAEPSTT